MTDPDDVWDRDQPQNLSPSQAAGVDAHYYAELVDDFYGDVFGRNSIDDAGMTIISTVHYDVGLLQRVLERRADDVRRR